MKTIKSIVYELRYYFVFNLPKVGFTLDFWGTKSANVSSHYHESIKRSNGIFLIVYGYGVLIIHPLYATHTIT